MNHLFLKTDHDGDIFSGKTNQYHFSFFSDADSASTSTPLSSNSNSPVRDTDHVADHHDDAHSAPPGGEEVNQHTELISIPVKPINNNIPSNNSLPRMGKDQLMLSYNVSGALLWRVYTVRDRDRDRDKITCIELCGGVHTAQRQKPMRISIGFCTHFISIGLSLGVIFRQLE